jgi:hypothetical protein
LGLDNVKGNSHKKFVNEYSSIGHVALAVLRNKFVAQSHISQIHANTNYCAYYHPINYNLRLLLTTLKGEIKIEEIM